MEAFTSAGYAVIGCSADTPALQSAWKDKQSFNFDLICDQEKALIQAVGMMKGSGGISRGNVIVGPDGVVKQAAILSPGDSVSQALALAGGGSS